MTGGADTSSKKPKMSDTERSALMAKMDADLEEHFAELERKAAERGPRGKDPDGWTEENWEEEMQKHPFFNQGWKEGEELPPLMQGLQDLKYSPDENTPEELAKNYKEDGNFNFKCKKYRFATASYTEGLKVKCGVKEVETALLTNRAAAQFHVANYRSSLIDCRAALALSPTHLKAIIRAAQCEAKLNRGLEVEQNEQLTEMRAEYSAKAKQVERDERKRAAKEKKKKEETSALLDAVKKRGVEVNGGLSMEMLEPLHPAAVQRRVGLIDIFSYRIHIKVRLEDGKLVWPVLFLYPEKGETDFIEEFREEEQFLQHLEVMLGETVERPGWDLEGRFTPDNVQLYFENKSQELVKVNHLSTLAEAVCKSGFLLKGGTPAFINLISKMVVRTYEDEQEYLEKINDHCWRIKKGFQPNMNVEGRFYVNAPLEKLMLEELRNSCRPGQVGGFLPGVKQIANVAALPGIVGHSVGLPDVHSGYGFAIGNMAAFDMDDPKAVVSPGGVGFDINCGVRLLRTNLREKDVQPVKEQLAQSLFDHIPVGVGSKGIIPMGAKDLEEALEMGMDWSLREGYCWAEDKEHCEEYGSNHAFDTMIRMLNADPSVVSNRAKKRGLPQLGTLGAGNHYAEIQVVDEIYDKFAASKMGIEETGQVVLMIHCGSRGFGHQVATDALVSMEKAMKRDDIEVNDRQLACARIDSKEGQEYLNGMAAAANFAWVNRSSMTFLARQAFAKMFNSTPDDLDMHVIYDVSHNIAKVEEHLVEGKRKRLLVHRKGSTRAFPPHHPLIPVDYQLTGQPVLIGGTMGTCSYVLTGTEQGMQQTFGSTCHGAGRALSRAKSRRNLDFRQVLDKLADQGISVRVASPKLVMEEAPESYKNVTDVVNTCHAAGISKKAIKLRPIAVIKG